MTKLSPQQSRPFFFYQQQIQNPLFILGSFTKQPSRNLTPQPMKFILKKSP